MTLGSLLNSNFGSYKTPINDRGEHISYSPSWKGSSKGGKGPQSALSALTLLAFLFFLNILQTCLRDQLAYQSPLVIMMTTQTTTTTTEGARNKRDVEEERKFKGDPADRHPAFPNEQNNFYRNMSKLYNNLYEFPMTNLQKEMKIKKHVNDNVENGLGRSFWLKTINFSPWLQSVFCCTIISCPNNDRWSDTSEKSSNYVNGAVSHICH